MRQAQVEHDQIDGRQIGAHPREQLRRALDGHGFVSRALERGPETVAHERSVVGDDNRLGCERGAGHLGMVIIIGMATCPECDAEIEVDEFDVDKGDQLSCPECGSNLEVTGLAPLELDIAPDDDDDEEEDDDDVEDEDDDLDDDEDDEDDEAEDEDGGLD